MLKYTLTEILKDVLKTIVTEARDNNWISDNKCKFLFNEHPRLASFYLLPKLHKNLETPPGRLVVSDIGSLREPVAKYIDYFLKLILPSLPAYIQETTAVLNMTEQLGKVGEDTLLVTMDVDSLYTSILHEEGLAALEYFLSERSQTDFPPANFLPKLTRWNLNNNIFIFQDRLFKQAKEHALVRLMQVYIWVNGNRILYLTLLRTPPVTESSTGAIILMPACGQKTIRSQCVKHLSAISWLI